MPFPYAIDGTAVNDRIDWTHVPPASPPSSRREEGFPGSSLTFLVTGPRRGLRLIVEGWLQGSSFGQLHAAVSEADALRYDDASHAVSIHGVTYDGCGLLDFQVLGKPVAFGPRDSPWTRVLVRYVWQQLAGVAT